ncbi:MAG: FAD-dependent oxidoreductase [Bacillota bacterium]|nr:FAD-dependent oxidoreductase [Bacillota bacterium]
MEEYDRLKAAEDKMAACREKEPPFCVSVCPFHYDVREFIDRMQRGSFNSAFRSFYNGVGFPELVAKLCPGYCRDACPRSRYDAAIDLPRLEQAALEHAANTRPTSYNLPPRAERFAIVGGGISGLACALRLCQRKYQVTLFEKDDSLGGHLRALLPAEELQAAIDKQFIYEQYQLRLNCRVDDIAPLLADYDAVYVATGAGGSDFGLRWQGELPAAGDRERAFVGGSLGGADTMHALAQGLNAAALLESYAKTRVMRGADAYRPTRMQVDEEVFGVRPPQQVDGGYDKQQAQAEAQRCVSCRCDACLRHCPMLGYFDKFPLRLRDEVHVTIYPATLDHNGTVAQRMISTCSQCGLCGEVCPQDIDLGDFLRTAHQMMTTRETFPWAFHYFWLRDMEHARSERAALTAAPAVPERSKYLFFPGCQTGASEPRYVTEGYALLRRFEPDCAIALGCCGAPAVWAGQKQLQEQVFAELRELWLSLGKPQLILTCPSCMEMFARYLPELPALLFSDFIIERGAAPLRQSDSELAVFDPCALRRHSRQRQGIRALARQAGCRLHELPYHGERAQCCSFGGQIDDTNPTYAKWLVSERAAASELPYLVSCANCRDLLTRQGKSCVHILDLLLGLERGDGVAGVNERLNNREQVKRQIIERFFPERRAGLVSRQLPVSLSVSSEVAAKLDAERILIEDVAAVIAASIASGRISEDQLSGHYFGYGAAGRLTLWAEFEPQGDGYVLYNAYQHRMSIESEDD